MLGSLSFGGGVLYVGRHASTAHVRAYDLDGRPLGPGFSFRAADGGRASVDGLAVDGDHRVWIADGACGVARCFTQFGRELPGVVSTGVADTDVPGSLGHVVDVATRGVEDDARTLVASGGHRRHALQLFSRDGEFLQSLRPLGDPLGAFRGVARAALLGRMVYACEPRAARIQVFRDEEFHFALRIEPNALGAATFAPRAIAPLANGAVVVAHADGFSCALLLLDASGRPLRTLASRGTEVGEVFEPTDVAIYEGRNERDTLIAVIDCDAERVQLFTLDGRCYGAFVDLPGAASAEAPRRARHRRTRE